MSAQLELERQPDPGIIVLDSKVPDKVIWPIAGGKGGTGKSTLTANMGVGLSLLGYKVILVDGDLGGADLHLFFDQIAPSKSLNSFLSKEVENLEDVLLPTPNENLKLICGGNEMVGLANMPYRTKEKLKRHIQALDADFVLIDLGAGTSYNTLDFFGLSEEGIIVCTPDPHARVDAYGFIKNTVYRKLRQHFGKNKPIKETIEQFARQAGRRTGRIKDLIDVILEQDVNAGQEAVELLNGYRPKLILNQVRSKKQVDQVHRFLALVKEYLSTEMEYVGYVRSDTRFLDACERRLPLLIDSPKASAARDLYDILMTGLKVQDRLHRFSANHYRKMAEVAKASAKFW
jgi:flagellar biosynthesis protein FlhG